MCLNEAMQPGFDVDVHRVSPRATDSN
jgi:hypothetical protein